MKQITKTQIHFQFKIFTKDLPIFSFIKKMRKKIPMKTKRIAKAIHEFLDLLRIKEMMESIAKIERNIFLKKGLLIP